MPAQHQPNTAMKRIAAAALAVLLLASPGHSKEAAQPQQKIVYLEANLSDCLRGDECPEPKLEEGELRQRQILPLLLSQGWRVVSITPVRSSRVGMNSVVSEVSFAYVLLQKP